MERLLDSARISDLEPLVLLGVAHEEQHQELLLMDILHLFAQSLLKPPYDSTWVPDSAGRTGNFMRVQGGLTEIGSASDPGEFAFDNERPKHKVWTESFEIADHLVTNGEWLAFMNADGYRRPEL